MKANQNYCEFDFFKKNQIVIGPALLSGIRCDYSGFKQFKSEIPAYWQTGIP
jgi:hypothetical protein